MKLLAQSDSNDYDLIISPDLKALGLISDLNKKDSEVDDDHMGTFFCPFCKEHKVFYFLKLIF